MYFNEQSTKGVCVMTNEILISNEELVELVKQKNDVAFSLLLNRFSKFIFFKCRCYYNDSFDIEFADLVQECEITLYKSALDFKPELGFLFTTYFKSALAITIKRELKKACKKKNNELRNNATDCNITFFENVSSPHIEETPECYILRKESRIHLQDKIDQSLSFLEKTCLLLYIKGLSYNEIAKKLDVLPKTVENALHRTRLKLSKYLDIDEILNLFK